MGKPGCNGCGNEDQCSNEDGTPPAKKVIQRVRKPTTAAHDVRRHGVTEDARHTREPTRYKEQH